MSKLHLRRLTKTFGSIAAVQNVDLEVADGEFLVIVGPSGCGKTTTLRMIAGLETVTSGTIEMDGVCINEIPAKDRNVAMVFQSCALFPHMHVLGNLTFGLTMRRTPRNEIQQRLSDISKVLQIEDLMMRTPDSLSGGQQQRVALGKNFVRRPNLFLYDEPLSNLDVGLRAEMRQQLKSLHEQLETTTIYVTHDQNEAMCLADRICVMFDAQIQQVGTPRQVYQSPANLIVAKQIGALPMNLMEGRLTSDRGTPQFTTEGVSIELSHCPEKNSTSPSEVILGIRPENVVLDSNPQASGIGTKVVSVEFLGDHLNVVLKTCAGKIINAKTTSDDKIQKGQSVMAKFAEPSIHWFDKKGQRLN